MSSLLINASNLHAGGGVQVAASFVNEIANGLSVDDKLKVVVSNEVSKNLNEQKKRAFWWPRFGSGRYLWGFYVKHLVR